MIIDPFWLQFSGILAKLKKFAFISHVIYVEICIENFIRINLNILEKPSEVDLRERIIRNDEEAVKNILHNKIPYLPFPENTSPLMYAVLTADTPIVSRFDLLKRLPKK